MKVIKNKDGQTIAAKVYKFRVEAAYYTGYGANLRRLRSIKKEIYHVITNNRERACELVAAKTGLRQGLSSGYIFKAIKEYN